MQKISENEIFIKKKSLEMFNFLIFIFIYFFLVLILFTDYENKTCVSCEANCASCQDRSDYCTSCEHHLVMHEHRCYSACPEFTYETEDYQ